MGPLADEGSKLFGKQARADHPRRRAAAIAARPRHGGARRPHAGAQDAGRPPSRLFSGIGFQVGEPDCAGPRWPQVPGGQCAQSPEGRFSPRCSASAGRRGGPDRSGSARHQAADAAAVGRETAAIKPAACEAAGHQDLAVAVGIEPRLGDGRSRLRPSRPPASSANSHMRTVRIAEPQEAVVVAHCWPKSAAATLAARDMVQAGGDLCPNGNALGCDKHPRGYTCASATRASRRRMRARTYSRRAPVRCRMTSMYGDLCRESRMAAWDRICAQAHSREGDKPTPPPASWAARRPCSR